MDIGNDVELIDDYYEDSYAETVPHNKAIGWKGLKLGRIIQGRYAPYLIVRNGSPIGWAPPSSVKKITQPTPIIQTAQTQTQTQVQTQTESAPTVQAAPVQTSAQTQAQTQNEVKERFLKNYKDSNNKNPEEIAENTAIEMEQDASHIPTRGL